MAAVKSAIRIHNMPSSPPSSPVRDLANDWEDRAFASHFGHSSPRSASRDAIVHGGSTTYDSVIYPGLYSASGLDVMGILLWTITRPNPVVDIGPVDCSVPVVVCDLTLPDQPLIYVSDSFLSMTGYKKPEVMGRNCRFLQVPGGNTRSKPSRKLSDKGPAASMRDAVQRNVEIQLKIDNYKKDGTKFTNLVTMIPVTWNSVGYNLSLGLLCDMDA